MTNLESETRELKVNSFKAHGCYKVSKIKEKHSDCQDSYSLSTERCRVAISDGATQSFYSGLWSHILCSLYCTWPKLISYSHWTEWNDAARVRWIEEVNKKLEELKGSGKPSWIECLNGIKLKKDAFATFIGISLEDSYLHGICIGDSCAMLVRITKETTDNEGFREAISIIRTFPGLWKHSFDSRTTGLSSYNSDLNHLPEFFQIPVPLEKNKYRILLMTDALAQYVLDREGEGTSIIHTLLSIGTQEEFAQYIDKCRETGLANDDTTLVVVEVTDSKVSSELGMRQDNIGRINSIPIDDPQVHEECANDTNQDPPYQSLQPSLVELPHALPPSTLRAEEAKTSASEIHNQQDSCILSQANISSNESEQISLPQTEIPSQSASGYVNLLNNAEARPNDSAPDNEKRLTSRSVSLPFPEKKN